jgi:hypothetical protein
MTPRRFTVTLDADDYARLRALAYSDEMPVAVKARDLLLAQLALDSRDDDGSPAS